MKVVLTMTVRDEEDILGAHLAYHLNAGVDLVLVTDHRSVDGTKDILEPYVKAGVVRVFREESEHTRQGEWMTRMARVAAEEHGVGWVLNGDADEFWWPRGGSIRDVLAAIPEPFGLLHAVSRYFVPRPDGDAPFYERMDVRLRAAAPINDPATPFRPVSKVAHRADGRAVVQDGNHTVANVPFASLRGWRPLEILHFPLRSSRQCARKYEKTWLAWEHNLRGDLARARALSGEARLESFYERVAVEGAMLDARPGGRLARRRHEAA